MMLRTKCIKAPIEPSDGLRISVMSRHTLNDGVTPDLEIIDAMFDEHRPDLAPPIKLVGSYYKSGLDWRIFEKEYVDYLRLPEVDNQVLKLANFALNNTVTIMCVELEPEMCHRRLLAEHARLLIPGLDVLIR